VALLIDELSQPGCFHAIRAIGIRNLGCYCVGIVGHDEVCACATHVQPEAYRPTLLDRHL